MATTERRDRYTETSVGGEPARRRWLSWPPVLVLAATGLVAGSAIALTGGGRPFWLLPAFVGAMMVYMVARLPALLAAAHPLRQAAYVVLLPLSATVFVAAFYLLWGHLAVAVIVGGLGGVIVQAAFNPAVVGSTVADAAGDAPAGDMAPSAPRRPSSARQ